jgi:phosphatidylethanolamine/phosphatidyl-N-methylethanolamine N-methyltransferase
VKVKYKSKISGEVMSKSANRSILKNLLQNPLQMGTVKESSKALARLMIKQVPPNPDYIVEFGAGTAPITDVLAQNYPPEKIYSFELNKDLYQKARARVPGVRFYNCNVIEAPQILPDQVVGRVDAILSSLPLVNLSAETNREILQSAFKILKPHGVFVQFTYLPFLPPIQVHKELGLWSQFEGVEWWNLPPAYVWVFRRIDSKTKPS